MAMEGVELEFTPDALRELAAQALKKGTGARALRSLLERLMLDVMYEVPGQRRHPPRQHHAAGRARREQADCPPQAGPGSGLADFTIYDFRFTIGFEFAADA